MRSRKYNIRGTRYVIKHVRMKDRGLCTNPKGDSPQIKIQKGLRGIEHLEVLVHEVLHACLWDLDEEAVDESSVTIAAIIADYFRVEDREEE